MKILLIQPRLSMIDNKYIKSKLGQALNKFYAPPLAMEQLYAITPEDHDVKIIDERIGDKINYDAGYDIVGITAFTANIDRAYEISGNFKKRSIKVVLGGYHPSALPEEAKQHCDSVIIGEAEYTWPKLLKDVKNDNLKPFYIGDCVVHQNDIPAARRDQTNNKYIIAAVQASRGCPNRCDFCSISNMKYGAIVRKRPVENVVDEIKTISRKTYYFYDPSLTSHPKYSKSLFKKLKGINKYFSCNGNVGTLYKDEELLKLANEAGCKKWYIGFESFSQKNISQIGKKTNKVKEYRPAIKKIHDYGMQIHGHFVFGLDNDTVNVFENTLEAIKEIGLTTAGFHVMTPFPGTPLFARLEKEGRIISKDWSRYLMSLVNYKPKLMTIEELTDGVKLMYKKFYSYKNFAKAIIKRENLNSNVLYSLISNYWFSNMQFS